MASKENRMVSGDTAGVTTRGVLPHTPVNHTVFSYTLPSRSHYRASGTTYVHVWESHDLNNKQI